MKPSDHLFKLIKSLTKSEKRYFRLYTQFQKGEKVYLAIVDILGKMSSYNEQELKQILSDKRIEFSQIHVTKNYLYKLILKSLRSYNDGRSAYARISNLMEEGILLEQKGLYDQYAKRIKAAIHLSKKFEFHQFTVDILKRQILYSLGRKERGYNQDISQLQSDLKMTIDLITGEYEYEVTLQKLFAWYRNKSRARNEIELREISEFQNLDLLKNKSKASTFRSKISLYFSHALIQQILGEKLKLANFYYQKVLDVWDEYEHLKFEFTKIYKIHLSNYLNSCHSIGKYDVFPDILDCIVNLPANSFDEQAEEFQNVAYLRLLYRMNTLQHDKAVSLIPEITKGIKQYGSKINRAREIAFYCNIAILYFSLEDYNNAIKWIINILNLQGIDHRVDVQGFARVMQLIIHYEMGNYILLDNLYRSTYRNLSKRNNLHKFELLVMHLVKKIQRIVDEKDRIVHIEKFVDQTKILQMENAESKTIGLSELNIWAQSKLSGKSYLQTLRDISKSN